jgi:hypothetical protein
MTIDNFEISMIIGDLRGQRCVREDAPERFGTIRAVRNGDSVDIEIFDYAKNPPDSKISNINLDSKFMFLGLTWMVVCVDRDKYHRVRVMCKDIVPMHLLPKE